MESTKMSTKCSKCNRFQLKGEEGKGSVVLSQTRGSVQDTRVLLHLHTISSWICFVIRDIVMIEQGLDTEFY